MRPSANLQHRGPLSLPEPDRSRLHHLGTPGRPPGNPHPIREAAFSSLKAPVRLVLALADPADVSEERGASGRRRIPLYDSRKTTARLARSS